MSNDNFKFTMSDLPPDLNDVERVALIESLRLLNMMDPNNQGAIGPGAVPAMDIGDWRAKLPPDSRTRIVNKIMETLCRHLPVTGQEALLELKKIAVRFEEKIYVCATSQIDYLRKISLKMLTMETTHQDSPSSLPSNSAVNSS